MELFSAKITARVNPSSSIADGAFTLITTLPRSSPARAAATSKLDGMALPDGCKPDGKLGITPDGVLIVVVGVTIVGVDGVVGVEIVGEDLAGVGINMDPVEVVICPLVCALAPGANLGIKAISANPPFTFRTKRSADYASLW